MKKRKATKISRKSSAKLKKMLAEFDVSKHGGEVMAYEPVGVEFPSKADPQGSTAPRYRTVDGKGRIYLQEDLIGRVLRITAQPDGTWLLEPTDDVPESERWAHAPKMARALARIGTAPGGEEIQPGQMSSGSTPAASQAPAYEPDDGPLTKQELKELRTKATEKLPIGKLLKTSTLFPSEP